MAKIETIFFQIFFSLLCASLCAAGSGEGQYEYEAHVELSSKENKDHTGILWTYLTDFESYKSVHRFIGQKSRDNHAWQSPNFYSFVYSVLLRPGSVISSAFNYSHKIETIDFERVSFLWKLCEHTKDASKQFIYLKSLTLVPAYVKDLASRANQTVILQPQCACKPIYHLGRVELKKAQNSACC